MWVDVIAVLAAIAAAVFAWLSWKRSGDAIDRSDDANASARTANTIARQEQAHARLAHLTSVESATAAKRSALAAEAAEERQRFAELRSLEVHDVEWILNPSEKEPGDLVLKNKGPHDAYEVIVGLRDGSKVRHFELGTVLAGTDAPLECLIYAWADGLPVAKVLWVSPAGVPHRRDGIQPSAEQFWAV